MLGGWAADALRRAGARRVAIGWWWYANNLLFLWFGAIALGTAYYMIPKVSRPVSVTIWPQSVLGYALFSSWTGMQRLSMDRLMDDYGGEHRGDDPHDDSGSDRWLESSHDHADFH
jgi:TRAP-type C4-dicarboxylate transport system permease small subunit